MPLGENELKEQLLIQAEQVIEQLLKSKNGRQDLKLSELEDLAGQLEAELGQRVLQTLVTDKATLEVQCCGVCQGKLRYKGQKSKRLQTLRGEIELVRAYYVCEDCQGGFFPPR